ncbi:hypothetical protein M404DRAFT_761487 [Pisolithus tinctorius Marx 270]|uniref:Uncharacterized protein n=1 Tax=Pisolithus tinctorius Marx 270 TaxID=870435 RepID=A0A0C3NHL7_PISTI|nr:hypothetical protein M404DRAFT_761487 [Pisolithus tinctorius Marx 270]
MSVRSWPALAGTDYKSPRTHKLACKSRHRLNPQNPQEDSISNLHTHSVLARHTVGCRTTAGYYKTYLKPMQLQST